MSFKIFFFSFFAIILLFSCSNALPQSYFIPHESNTLGLQDKKELKVTGGLKARKISHTIIHPTTFEQINKKSFQAITNFQVAYSPIKHLGVFAVHNQLRFKDPENSSINFHKSHITGGGIGTYFSFIAKQRPSKKLKLGKIQKYNNFIVDLYGGYVLGKLENHYNDPVGNTKMDFEKFYLQGGIHWQTGRWQSRFFYKIGGTNYENGSINGKPNNLNDSAILTIKESTEKIIFQELTLKLDYKIKSILLFSQVTIGTIPDFNFFGIANPIMYGGVVINIHQFNKKTNR